MAQSSRRGAASQPAGKAAAPHAQGPVTGTPTGAGPDVQGQQIGSGVLPELSEERHGGAALEGKPEPGATPGAGKAADTGPVVEHTGGGLAFERKPSGTRANPRKEQPTTPERAEIIEARRLEQEIQRSRQNPAQAATGRQAQKGDRVRVLRNAASGWELGTITYLAPSGQVGSAELDGGEVVGLEIGRWEPAVGALAAPEFGPRTMGPDEVERRDIEAARSAGQPVDPKSQQKAAKPTRAKSSAKKSAKKSASRSARKAASR